MFQPMSGTKASAKCEIFADGFAGAIKTPEKADHRPDGVAAAPDGSLFISDDIKGRIYRVTWNGGSADGTAGVTACPSLTAGAGALEKASAKPPEGTNPDAGAPVPKGATSAMVAAGDKLYHANACIGCHGDSGPQDMAWFRDWWVGGRYADLTARTGQTGRLAEPARQ